MGNEREELHQLLNQAIHNFVSADGRFAEFWHNDVYDRNEYHKRQIAMTHYRSVLLGIAATLKSLGLLELIDEDQRKVLEKL